MKKWMENYLDDLLFLAGVGLLVRAGFIIGDMWGYCIAGVGCIAYSAIIAKGRRL